MKCRYTIIVLIYIMIVAVCPRHVSGQAYQEVHVSGSPNPVGAGARALGMGGAFIGVADDATAASWNPGGLIQLETPEISLVLSYDKLYEKRSFKVNPGASGNYSIDLYDLNYMSMAYPFTFRDLNMIVSLNYQTMYNFNKEHNYNYNYQSHDTIVIAPGPPMISNLDESGQRQTIETMDGYLKALSPAMAIQVTSGFSLGIAWNFFHPDLGSKWKKETFDIFEGVLNEVITFGGVPIISNSYSISSQYRGTYDYTFQTSSNPFNFDESSYNIGFLWHINSYFTLGGVYKPGYTAKVHFKEGYERSQDRVNLADPNDVLHETTTWIVITDEEQEMVMPASYGLGLSCRFSDQFTMDLDIYRTDWQDFLLRQANGWELSMITGRDKALTDTKPTYQVRLGGEYLYLYKYKYAIPFRAGIFYDPEPTEKNPDDFFGFSIGSGIATNKFAFDIAYQYRWGNDVRKVQLGTEEIFQDVKQHTIYASIIYYF